MTLPTSPLPQLDTQLIWPDPLQVVVSAQHPWAQQKSLQLQDLAEMPAVLPDESTYTHRIVRAALLGLGVEPQVRMATNYLETLKMLVTIGLGWSVLPETMLDDSVVRLNVDTALPVRRLGVVTHPGRSRSNAAGAFLDILSSGG